MTPKQRIITAFVLSGITIAAIRLILDEEWLNLYTVLIGAAYFWYDRVEKDTENENPS